MNNCFIILAGGESKRFNSITPKSYYIYKGKPLLLHSIDKAKNYNKFVKIILVINKKHKTHINKLKIKSVKIIIGGETRAESAYKALKSLKGDDIDNVMIHDAARPNFSLNLLDRLNKELKLNDCVIPAIQTNDSIKQKTLNKIINLKRENIYLIQTPQAFNYKKLYKLQNNKSIEITDDANLFVKAGKKIKIINGEINNIDINIITQKPKIQKYKKKIINCIAKICKISSTQINIKGKTTEKLGVIGKEKAIACEVITSVIKYD